MRIAQGKLLMGEGGQPENRTQTKEKPANDLVETLFPAREHSTGNKIFLRLTQKRWIC